MTHQQRPTITHIITGTLVTAAILVQAPYASAGIATASLIATNHPVATQTEAAARSTQEPCEHLEQGSILSEATDSIASLGNDSPLAQASVLIAGLGCLAGGSLLLKRGCH